MSEAARNHLSHIRWRRRGDGRTGVCFVMRNLKSDPATRNVHIWSDLWRSMDSEWHKMWWSVKVSVARGASPVLRRRDLLGVAGSAGRGAGEEAGSLVNAECHSAMRVSER